MRELLVKLKAAAMLELPELVRRGVLSEETIVMKEEGATPTKVRFRSSEENEGRLVMRIGNSVISSRTG